MRKRFLTFCSRNDEAAAPFKRTERYGRISTSPLLFLPSRHRSRETQNPPRRFLTFLQHNIWRDSNSAHASRDATNWIPQNAQLFCVAPHFVQMVNTMCLLVLLQSALERFETRMVDFSHFICTFSPPAPKCTGFTECVSPQVLMNGPSSKTCGAATCMTTECCVDGTFLFFSPFPLFFSLGSAQLFCLTSLPSAATADGDAKPF